jgi:hypothetical protein
MSSHCSQESEDLILDLNEPVCESSGNASSTPSAEPSSNAIGRECLAPPTSPDSTLTGSEVMASEHIPHQHIWEKVTTVEPGAVSPCLSKSYGYQIPSPLILFTSSQAVSPAKTCQLPESEPALPGKEVDSSMKQHESQTLFSETGDGSSLRTFPDFFPATKDATSPSYSRRWPTSGFTTSPGECWTADTSECPNGGGEFSSLPDVLEATVPNRFYLSQKAAAGILRRAEKRGRELPPALDRALRTLSTEGKADPTTTPHRQTTSSQEAA